jgi:ubiquinone/menaquinone biosynthesis C-methylase UbiE
MASEQTSGDYGIDAPGLVLRFIVLAGIGILGGSGLFLAAKSQHSKWMGFVGVECIFVGGAFLATAAIMVWGSRCGKLRLRDRIISSIAWRGDETVLDVGCGRGLLLLAAAKRLTTGKAIGVDLWQVEDQSGNSRDTTTRNAQKEQVADRVVLQDGDARKLEFADGTFDVVLSSWAIHNIYDVAGRELAIREISRVLKPGGLLFIVDIRHTKGYAAVLRECRMVNVKRTGPNFLFGIPSFLVTASKPADAAEFLP